MHRKEYDKIVNALSLESAEMNGGHLIERHIDVSDSDLKDRCISEKKKLSTGFTVSKEEILHLIQETLLDEEFETPDCVLEWLDDDSDGGDFYAIKDFTFPIGRGYFRESWHEWSNGAASCHSITVVLRKVDRRTDTTFRIVTAYPTVTEEDIKNTKILASV